MKFTRVKYTDTMKVGEVGWHKEVHLIILVQRMARPNRFKERRILQTKEDDISYERLFVGWLPPMAFRRGVFTIPPRTLLISDKRVRQIVKDLGLSYDQS